MQLTKISAERKAEMKNPSVNTNVQFLNVEKDSLEMLKDHNILKITFSYTLSYSNKQGLKEISEKDKDAEVVFEGTFHLSVSAEEEKEFEKSWKKKTIPREHLEVIFNIILRRCTLKALPIQDELAIPSPFLNIPPIKIQGSEDA